MSKKVGNTRILTDEDMGAYLNDEIDCTELGNLFEEDQDEEYSDSEAEVVEEFDDVVSATNTEDDCVSQECTLVYRSRDGTEWSKQPVRKSRQGIFNVIKTKAGPSNPSGYSTEEDVFRLFITDEIIDIIVTETNRKAEQMIDIWNTKYPAKKRQWNPTDAIEIRAYLGLLIVFGATKASQEPVEFLWCTDRAFVGSFAPATMSRIRFQNLTSLIRFDDFATRAERKATDRLAPIRQVFEIFVQQCKQSYVPESHLTVDEQLVAYRGRCSFRVYMKSKPDKYGIKIWALADATNAYTMNMQVYLGKQGNAPEKNQGERVVLDLVDHVKPGHGITCDNFFTSLSLAEKLLNKSITLCGTVRKNKTFIPEDLMPKLYKPIKSSMFAFTKNYTLVSYVPKRNQAVILLSTEHFDDSVSGEDHDFKPDIILHYNATKGAVDTTDKMAKQYTTLRGTNRWPFVIFCHLLDIAGINAFRLWEMKLPDQKKTCKLDTRRKFLLSLGKMLVREHIIRRYKIPSLQKDIKKCMCDVVPELSLTVTEIPPVIAEGSQNVSGRCYICTRKRDRKCRHTCAKCHHYVCVEHSVKETVCHNCK